MTELELRPDGIPASQQQAAQNITGGAMRLVEWAEEARAAHHLASALCKTPFAGQYRNDPDAATAAILKGAEVGLTPVTALGAFDLIQGTPAAKAITLRALVQSHGHEVIVDKSTDDECHIRGRRKGAADWQPVTWTIKQAQRLGLTNKDNWKRQPKAMLVARATSEVCRLIASDVILGIGYSSEEVSDLEPQPTRTMQRRTAKRAQPPPASEPPFGEQNEQPAQQQQPEPEPDFEQPPPEQFTDPDPPEDGITSQQLKKIGAAMREYGIEGRNNALAYVSKVVGRDVGSRNDLGRQEASDVIDALAADLEARDREQQAGEA